MLLCITLYNYIYTFEYDIYIHTYLYNIYRYVCIYIYACVFVVNIIYAVIWVCSHISAISGLF